MRLRSGALAAALLSLCFPNTAQADEGGVSFWVPGIFGQSCGDASAAGIFVSNDLLSLVCFGGEATLLLRARSTAAISQRISPAM